MTREAGLQKEEALALHGMGILRMMAGVEDDAQGFFAKEKAIIDKLPEIEEHPGVQNDNDMLRAGLLEAEGILALAQMIIENDVDAKKVGTRPAMCCVL
jgi:hypothetical protein